MIRADGIRWIFRILCALAFAGFVGCAQKTAPAKDAGVLREASVEGLHLSVHVASDEITTSEMLRAEVVIRSAESLKVVISGLNESTGKWGDFFVFEKRTSPARLDENGMVVQSWVFILEPDISGEGIITGLTVRGVDEGAKAIEVSSQPVSVVVTSVLADGENTIRDIAPNDRIVAQGRSPRWQIAVLMMNVLVVLGLILWWQSRKRNAKVEDVRMDQDFEILEAAPVTEVMNGIERAVCRVLAQQRGVTLTKVDFAGLQEVLGDATEDAAGLREAIACYQRIQYAPHAVDEAQVRDLYTQFETIIDQQTKELAT